MKQISFFTRGTMAALTKEEGGPLSCSASSHPTSVPRINPFHLRLCGDTTLELPNKGGRKAPPCPGVGAGGGRVGVPRVGVPHLAPWGWPCPFPIRTFSTRSYLLPWLRGVRRGSFVPPQLLFLWELDQTEGEASPGACLHPRSSGCFMSHRG